MITFNRILVMLAVTILGDSSYGNNVAGLIINTTGKHESMRGGIYVTLHRLRDIGWLDQWVAGPDTPRPFYSVTTKGKVELIEALDEINALKHLVKKALK